MLECLFKKTTGLKSCNFIKKRLQHWVFRNFLGFLHIAKFLSKSFYRTPPVAASETWKYWSNFSIVFAFADYLEVSFLIFIKSGIIHKIGRFSVIFRKKFAWKKKPIKNPEQKHKCICVNTERGVYYWFIRSTNCEQPLAYFDQNQMY